MGPAPVTGLAVALAWVALVPRAHAEPRCTGSTSAGGHFATCFDPGNRLSLEATTEGFGGSISLRHTMLFDDEPDLIWKLEHRLLHARAGGLSDRYEAVVYSGRFIRHARDGHIVLPFAVGRKLFLPFDIGAEAVVGRLSGRFGEPILEIGVVQSAALIDLSRSERFRRRLSIGTIVRWNMEVEHEPVGTIKDHVVVPFTTAVVDAYAESRNGLTMADLRVEGGRQWSSRDGWQTALSAAVSVERVLVAINDRPVSLLLGARYSDQSEELMGEIGVRFALYQRLDRRVNLRPLKAPE